MLIVSMEGFGVIDFRRLTDLKDTFAVLSRLIDYPDTETFSPEIRQLLLTDNALSTATRGELLSLFDEFKDCFKNEKFDKTIKEATKNKAKIDIDKLTLSFGYDAVFNCISKIIKNIKKCKKQVYAFISAISETNIEEVAKLNLWKVAKNLLELSKDEDFKDFLEVASSLKK